MDLSQRQERIAKARAILTHSQYQSLSRKEQKKIENSLVSKGLSRKDLNRLRREIQEQKLSSPRAKQIDIRTLPKDVFRHLILTGELSGSDLIALCSVDTITQEKCNQDDYWIFRQLLLQEFNLKNYQHNPRDLYVIMHRIVYGWQILQQRMEDLKQLKELEFRGDDASLINAFENADLSDQKTVWELLYMRFVGGISKTNPVKAQKIYFILFFFDTLYERYLMQLPTNEDPITDMEDLWFDVVRPTLGAESSYGIIVLENDILADLPSPFNDTRRHVYNFTLTDVDNFWDSARELVSEIAEPDKKTLQKNYRRMLGGVFATADITPDTEYVISMLRPRYKYRYPDMPQAEIEAYLQTTREILNSITEYNIYKLTPEEVYALLMLHRLVVDGTISVTMPLSILG